jgi:hypothetical protein
MQNPSFLSACNFWAKIDMPTNYIVSTKCIRYFDALLMHCHIQCIPISFFSQKCIKCIEKSLVDLQALRNTYKCRNDALLHYWVSAYQILTVQRPKIDCTNQIALNRSY